MPRKKTVIEKNGTRTISYMMDIHVQEALEEIIKKEGHTTMTKAINTCILQRQLMIDALAKTEDELIRVNNIRYNIESELSKLVQFLDYLKKHTKTS